MNVSFIANWICPITKPRNFSISPSSLNASSCLNVLTISTQNKLLFFLKIISLASINKKESPWCLVSIDSVIIKKNVWQIFQDLWQLAHKQQYHEYGVTCSRVIHEDFVPTMKKHMDILRISRNKHLCTSKKRSPKYIFSPGSMKTSALALLSLEMIDFTPGTLLCKIQP